MTTYFIRRLMFVPVTFVIITFILYSVLRLTPGGPVEQARMALQHQLAGEGGAGGGALAIDPSQLKLSDDAIRQLQRHFKLDKSIVVGYLIWLGIWPDEVEDRAGQVIGHAWRGVLQGNFGTSYTAGRPVIEVIVSKFPVSIYFGLIGYILSWVVCVPLGVYKAIYHRSVFDTLSSVLVFIGYSIPGFVACLILLNIFATQLGWVPLGDFRSPKEQWETFSFWGKVFDQLHHTIVPVIGYMIGGFATMTILMKNSLMENFGADYVRTAFAKGLTEQRVIFLHALRNSLIPITAGIGHAIGLLFAGSFLIETVCNIQGMGLLGYTAILERDYPIIMAIAVFNTLILLLGNILSDLIWALIDPRIRFSSGR